MSAVMSAVFEQGPPRAFVARHGIDGAQDQAFFDDTVPQGFHPRVISEWATNAGERCAAVFEQGGEGGFGARNGITPWQYQRTSTGSSRSASGRRSWAPSKARGPSPGSPSRTTSPPTSAVTFSSGTCSRSTRWATVAISAPRNRTRGGRPARARSTTPCWTTRTPTPAR